MLRSTFCLQPPGDTLTRKGIYESFIAGCIPVVFREDDAFLQQLAFSRFIPYRQMWICLPALGLRDGSLDVVASLRAVPQDEVQSKRRAIRKWVRALSFSATSSNLGGYNDLRHPDAFALTLREVWRASKLGL